MNLIQVLPLFLAFAFSYFLSAALRGVMATLAPVLSAEFDLSAGKLGLLGGAYFLGFAALQLPLGLALDRQGPRRTLLCTLTLAVAGCVALSMAQSLPALIAARALMGAGLAACLMAPLTCFASLLSVSAQLRANSWLLMTGSLGMLASTLPVHWLLPIWGWRGLFGAAACGLLLAMGGLVWQVPPRTVTEPSDPESSAPSAAGYLSIVRHPQFVRLAPLGFFVYGGMIAVQSLWAGPWLTRLGGASASVAAQGLFLINLSMLLAFMTWGAVVPRLVRYGIDALALLKWGVPLGLVLLAWNVAAGAQAGAGHWAAWCVACTFVCVSQPAVGQAFPVALAGRALSAFNLVIFAGVFSVQWGIGLAIDVLRALAWPEAMAFQLAFSVFGLFCLSAYGWFLFKAPFKS